MQRSEAIALATQSADVKPFLRGKTIVRVHYKPGRILNLIVS